MPDVTPWPAETRAEALRRVANGETAKDVANDMGIGYETVRRWHRMTLEPVADPAPYPGDTALGEMTERLLKALWAEVLKVESRAETSGSIDARKVKDIFDAMKAADQMRRSNPTQPADKPASPLAALKEAS